MRDEYVQRCATLVREYKAKGLPDRASVLAARAILFFGAQPWVVKEIFDATPAPLGSTWVLESDGRISITSPEGGEQLNDPPTSVPIIAEIIEAAREDPYVRPRNDDLEYFTTPDAGTITWYCPSCPTPAIAFEANPWGRPATACLGCGETEYGYASIEGDLLQDWFEPEDPEAEGRWIEHPFNNERFAGWKVYRTHSAGQRIANGQRSFEFDTLNGYTHSEALTFADALWAGGHDRGLHCALKVRNEGACVSFEVEGQRTTLSFEDALRLRAAVHYLGQERYLGRVGEVHIYHRQKKTYLCILDGNGAYQYLIQSSPHTLKWDHVPHSHERIRLALRDLSADQDKELEALLSGAR